MKLEQGNARSKGKQTHMTQS